MHPTKATKLIKKTAEDLNMSEELVKDIVDFYYATVAKKMTALNNPTLLLHGLGTLKISRVKVRNKIEFLTKILKSNKQEDFRNVIRYKLTNEMLESYKAALERCDEYYKPLYEKRNKNLEVKGSNPGGDKE